MKFEKKLRRRIWPIVIVATFAGLAYALFGLPDSLADAGNRALDAVLRQDSRTLWRYVDEEERRKGSLSDASLKSLLQVVVGERLHGFKAVGPRKIDYYSNGEAASVSQVLRHPDGRQLPIMIVIGKAPNGPKLMTAVLSLSVHAAVASLEPGKPEPVGRDKSAFYANSFSELAPRLKGAGLSGFVRRSRTGHLTFITWEQYIAEQRRRAQPPAQEGTVEYMAPF